MSTDDFFEKRRRELGGVSAQDVDSFFDKRKAQLTPLSSVKKSVLSQEKDDQAEMAAASRVSDFETRKQEILKQEKDDQAEMAQASLISAERADEPLQGRDVPVIGPVLRGLDAFAENPVVDTVAKIGRSLYTPGAGVANVAGAYNAVGSALNRIAPKLGTTFGGRVAETAIKEAVVGAPLGAGQSLAQGNQLDDALTEGAVSGALFGGTLGAAGPVIGRGISAASNAAGRGLAQGLERPSLRSAIDEFTSRTRNEQPSLPASEGPSYSGVNLLSKTDQPLPTTEPVNAPTMEGNWFTNLFGNTGLGVSASSSSKRLSKGPLSTEDQLVKNGIRNDLGGVKESVAAQARAAYQNFVDKIDPLKRISDQTYETAMDASRANNIANTIIRDKFVTPEGTVVGEGLSNIFKKVARGQDKQFIDYLTLRHARTRLGRNERVYADTVTFNGQKMTPEVVQQRIDMYDKRHPGFAAIAQEWDQFNDNVLQKFGVEEGLISENLYKSLRDENPHYSPMNRQFSRSEKPGRNFLAKTTNSSFTGQRAPLKEVSPTGSMRDIVDPRKSTIENVGAWTNAAMRNRVMQSIVDAVKQSPEAFQGVIEIKPMVEEARQSSITEMNKLINEQGVEGMLESLNKDFELLFKKSPKQGLSEDNVVRAMVKGEPVYLQVHDPEIVKTLIGMGPQASNLVIDTLSALSNATKRGATGMLSPVFAVKGATMDLVQSAIQAKNPVQQAGYTVYAILSGIGDRLRIPGLKNLAEEYRRAGGEYSAALKGDRALNRSISNMTRDPLLSPKGVAKGALNAVATPFRALEAIGDIAENAPRMAAYKAELQRLGGQRTPENIRQAMTQARESTVNFSRRGAFSSNIESLVPYNNAAVQGTYRVMKAFKDNPIKTTAAVATLAVLPKLYEYTMFADDPDYKKLPARERSRFLIVGKNDDGSFTKIPMEPAYNSIGEMTIETLRYFKDNDPTAFKEAADALANAWLPPSISGALQGVTQGGGLDKSIAGALNSTVAAPFVATTSNQSFTGAPIESRAVQDRSPENRYDERTSGLAKWVSQYIGLSPMKTDYLLRAYGGDPARLLLPLTSQVGAGNTRNTLLKNFIVDPEITNTLSNDFYGGKEKLTQAYRDNQEVGTPLPSWFTEKLYKDVSSQAKGSISKKLSDLNEQKKKINADTRMNAEQKANNLREIQSQMNDIYLDINTELYKQGVPTK